LNSPGVNTAVPHNLTIGDSVGAASSAVVKLLQPLEIATTSNISVNSDGLLDMNSFGNTINNLVVSSGSVTLGSATLTLNGTIGMTGGSITATTGSLSLGGDITASSSATAGASITAKIALNANRTITVNAGAVQPEL